MISKSCLSNESVSAELGNLEITYYQSSKIQHHIAWISSIISRIISFQKSTQNSENNSPSPSSLLLNLSFVRISSIPQYSIISLLSKIPINLTSLSTGKHYVLITSILTNDIFTFDPNRSTSSQFDTIFKSLASIGFKPRQPCSQFGLMSGLEEHHVNLCETLEFAVFERSLSIEKLLEDIRKVPRSFFTISERYYPAQIEEAIALWLSQFPCIIDLPEIFYSDFEKFQKELSNGKYFSAVLSRIYPQRINKKSFIATENQSTSNNGLNLNISTSNVFDFNNDILNSDNWEKAKQILNELGAFVPSSFNLSYNLFMCFISDLYYATRVGVKKFVRIERSPSVISSSRRPQTTSASIKASSTTTINISQQKQNPTLFYQIEHHQHSDKSFQCRPRTGSNVFRPSRKQTLQNSTTTSISHPKKKTSEIHTHHAQCPKRPIKTAIPQKRSLLTMSNKNSNIKHSFSANTKFSIVDDETEFLHLYTCMTKGERKDKFIDVENPLIMIKPLCTLISSNKISDQTFINFWNLIKNEPQSFDHYKNCYAFLNALGGNNNELAASRRIVYFARQMLESYQRDPITLNIGENSNEKREIKSSYQNRRASLMKKAKKINNNLDPNSDIASIINASQSDSLIHVKL